MKVSEMIENLQKFMTEYGDLDCWYAKDDEGNGYNEVYYDPSMYWVDASGEVYNNTDDLEEYDLTIKDVTPICIVN